MATKKVKLPGEEKLKNEKHELFSYLYSGAPGYYFGNATRCYLYAFGKEDEIAKLVEKIDATWEKGTSGDNDRRRLKGQIKTMENSARSLGTRLLANVSIQNRTNFLLDRFLTDNFADREMAFVITQRDDLRSKVAAYQAVAKVKERIRGAGAITGEFSFEWEGPSGAKSKPGKVTATVRQVSDADEDEVDFMT